MISFFFFLFSFFNGNRFSSLQRHKKKKRVAETGFTLSCYSFHFDYFDFRGESQEKEEKLLSGLSPFSAQPWCTLLCLKQPELHWYPWGVELHQHIHREHALFVVIKKLRKSFEMESPSITPTRLFPSPNSSFWTLNVISPMAPTTTQSSSLKEK